MASTATQEQLPASRLVETKSTSASWYDNEPGDRLTTAKREFFSTYSNLKLEEVMPHLHSIHKKAWDLRPYPCIGQWGFLNCKINKLPNYARLLDRAKAGASLLDFGCCMGQDLRQLFYDGAPSERLFGADIEPGFWDLGYELFRDRHKFGARFIEASLLDENSVPLLLGSIGCPVDMIYVGSVLHLWDWNCQTQALRSIVALTRPGSQVFGVQIGKTEGRAVSTGWNQGSKTMFSHDTQTIQQLWMQVGTETGSDWEIKAELCDLSHILPEKRDTQWMHEDNRALMFEATRIR